MTYSDRVVILSQVAIVVVQRYDGAVDTLSCGLFVFLHFWDLVEHSQLLS